MGWRRTALTILMAAISGLSGWLFVANSQVPGARFLAALAFVLAIPVLWTFADAIFLTDFSLAEELKDGNVAIGVVVGLVFVGICVLVGLAS